MKSCLLLLGMVCVFSSCKKDRLEGDYEIFQGKWRWTQSGVYKQHQTYFTTTVDTIYASDSLDVYELEFLEKGKVRFLKNGTIVDEYRTVFTSFHFVGDFFGWSNVSKFSIDLDNDDENFFKGHLNTENMVMYYDFPFESYYVSAFAVSYKHYFTKV